MGPETLLKLLGTIFILLFLFWIFAIIDVVTSDFKEPSNKTIWIVLLIFLPPLGYILYSFMANSQKVKIPIPDHVLYRAQPEERDNWDIK
ncbi:MAG: PLDc_N domain-containing protein [Deltaproteobacteria bacterium]|nr:PLDc_N domain-containing protein [Deltaproteobacteria bacterium]TLN03806.1 MAG: PLDc_N domain-containing protein [bacterium]